MLAPLAAVIVTSLRVPLLAFTVTGASGRTDLAPSRGVMVTAAAGDVVVDAEADADADGVP
ncbi:hypothetical protein GCM10023145_26850 [Angustibacter luteus]